MKILTKFEATNNKRFFLPMCFRFIFQYSFGNKKELLRIKKEKMMNIIDRNIIDKTNVKIRALWHVRNIQPKSKKKNNNKNALVVTKQ